MLTEQIKIDIKKHAQSESPNECCGLILCRPGYSLAEAFPCRNIALEKDKFFTLDPSGYLDAFVQGDIIGFYHSHLESESFSDLDKVNAENLQLESFLYCLKTDKFFEYLPIGYQLPYVGRQYIVGYIDCFSIVRDYFLRELNIEISDIDHPYRFVEDKEEHPDNNQSYSIYPDHFISNGFRKVDAPVRHDVILIKTPKILSPVHAGIFLGNNELLHHPWKSESRIDLYRGFYRTHTTHILRHNTL